MEVNKKKKVWLGVMLIVVLLSLGSVSLAGCLVCRDCGPHPRQAK